MVESHIMLHNFRPLLLLIGDSYIAPKRCIEGDWLPILVRSSRFMNPRVNFWQMTYSFTACSLLSNALSEMLEKLVACEASDVHEEKRRARVGADRPQEGISLSS